MIGAQSGLERATSQQNLPECQLRRWAHDLVEHNSGVSTKLRAKCCYLYPTPLTLLRTGAYSAQTFTGSSGAACD
jgi:hypothetical protein